MKKLVFTLFLLSVGCVAPPTAAESKAVYPPPNCIFPKSTTTVCWLDLPGSSIIAYSGDARLLCEDTGPTRWLVIDRASNVKLQIVGGKCAMMSVIK